MVAQALHPIHFARKNALFFLSTLLAAVIAWISINSELSVRHFFTADDWFWISLAKFHPYQDFVHLLPRQIYNDRPVGAGLLKIFYSVLGLDSQRFLYAQAAVHVLNCVLLYLISCKYIGKFAGVVAATLAVSWLSANNAVYWTAAIFDLLGGTLCLLSIWLWQIAQISKRHIAFQIAGAIVYFLAIRTKEFTIGLPVVIFILAITLEKKSFRATIASLYFYIAVMTLLALQYLHLLSKVRIVGAQNDQYGLHFDSIFQNLWVYFSTTFYIDAFGLIGPCAAISVFFIAAALSAEFRQLLFFCFVGFVVMLGPTLLLTNHLDPLYLYAPHFFTAFAVAGLLRVNYFFKLAAVVSAAALIYFPASSAWAKNIRGFNEIKSSANLEKFESFFDLRMALTANTSIFIAGLDPYFNPFSYGPGSSVKIATGIDGLRFSIEKPTLQLISEFCKASAPKYFVVYNDNTATNDSGAMLSRCATTGNAELSTDQ